VYLPIFKNEEKWQEMLGKYHFNVIFFYHYDDSSNVRRFLYQRMSDPFWSLVYADSYAVILLKNSPENRDVIEKFGISRENVEEKLRYLAESRDADDQIAAADLFNFMGREDLGIAVFKRVVAEHPEKGRVWMILGEMELLKSNPPDPFLAMTYLEKAINSGQKTSEAYSFLGLAYFNSGQIEKAKDALQKSLKINPERQDAKDLLYTIQKNYPTIKINL
jgi:tetratricopeptide (TPR) repeat protein